MMLPAEGHLLKAVCLDKECQAILHVIPAERTVECHQCGQKFHKDLLQGLQEVSPKEVLPNFCRKLLIANRINGKRGPEMVKVLGLSNYYCKLLSPLLTKYGFDKSTNRAKLLTEMNQSEIFDCSTLADRAFLIEPEHISIAGFGKDITGSLEYLSETLKLIVASNGGEERLIPIHADGDGHCLVHAISRALVGRELFWHPLRCCLKKHFENNIENYKELFKDFIDIDEWSCIIQECDPNFQPPDGELHGLRNIHIFGLANVLRRPIILLDSLDCMQKCGDYSALFLPGFVSPEACRGKDNILNKPLCIAWSSQSHNHYIPLVGIQRLPLPVLPASLIPKVWGMPQSQVYQYIEFDSKGSCVIGGNRVLSSGYIQRLAHAMEILFYEINGIHPTLVADYKLYYCSDIMLLNVKTSAIVDMAKTIAQESRLYRCLFCWALNEYRLDLTSKEFDNICQSLRRHPYQNIHFEGYLFKYDKVRSEAKIEWSQSQKKCCDFCSYNIVRRVTTDGTVIYKAEDKDSPEKPTWYCEQVKKFYPEESFSSKAKYSKDDVGSHKLSLKLQWNDKEIEEQFSFEFPFNSRENLNEFVKELSNELLKKHFAEESSDFALQSYVSDEIWKELRKCDLCLPFRPITKKQETVKEKAENVSINDVPSKQPPSELRYIKVVTANGQQSNLPLPEEGVSYGQIQEMIRNEFNIPVSNQRIKTGFPPREIKPSGDTNKQILPLSHGDRLMVEVLRKEDHTDSILSSFAVQGNNRQPTWTKLQNDILWNILKVSPENFRRNGTIYKQVSEDNRLHGTMHTNLEDFPHKTFCYNPSTDSIELCVKPLGHFLVSADIDDRIEQVRNGEYVLGFCKCPLLAKLEEMNDAHTRRRATPSKSSEEIQGRPLIRKGPGFSVLTSPPDNMDIA